MEVATETQFLGSTDPSAITSERLLAVVGQRADLALQARALEAVRDDGELTSPRRVRHFLAQAAHETVGFARRTESFNYRDPARLCELFPSRIRDVHHARAVIAEGQQRVANIIYAGKCGNGDFRSWDGWNYRGRGYLQHTGRDNYAQLQNLTGLQLVAHPELLDVVENAALAAAAWWKAHGCNRFADADDSDGVSRIINPGGAGLAERTTWSGRFRPIYP